MPHTPEEWSIWSYAHRDKHQQAAARIQTIYNENLTQYPIDPIALDDFDDFLNANPRLHNDINGVLGTQGSDLTQADLTDVNQLAAWVWLHYKEHDTWGGVLHIG